MTETPVREHPTRTASVRRSRENQWSLFSSRSLARAFHGRVRYDSGQRFLIELLPSNSEGMA